MKFILNLQCDTDAFAENIDEETATVLENLADRVRSYGTSRTEDDPYALMDHNGNTVGAAYFDFEES